MTATVSGHPQMRALRGIVRVQGMSSVGSYLTAVTVPWIVLSLAGNGAALGLFLAITGLPRLLLMIPAGAAADRFSPRLVAVITNGVLGLILATLGLLAITGRITMGEIYVAGLLFSVSSAFQAPAQRALVRQIMPRGSRLIARANAWWQGFSSKAYLVGSALSALVLSLIPEGRPTNCGGLVFLIDAATYAVCLVMSWRSRPAVYSRQLTRDHTSTREGLRFVFSERGLLYTLLGSAGISVAVTGLLYVSIPVQLEQIAGGSSGQALSLTSAAFGVGGMLGAKFVRQSMLTPERIVRLLYGAILAEGALFAVTALAGQVWEIAAFEVAVGVLGSFSSISIDVMIQRATPDYFLARVGAIQMFGTMAPALGFSMLIGRYAQGHAPIIYILAAAAMLAGGYFVPRSRHVQALAFKVAPA